MGRMVGVFCFRLCQNQSARSYNILSEVKPRMGIISVLGPSFDGTDTLAEKNPQIEVKDL